MWYYLYLSNLQNEIWDLSRILIFGTLGSKRIIRVVRQVNKRGFTWTASKWLRGLTDL